jgi:hypothetical protein
MRVRACKIPSTYSALCGCPARGAGVRADGWVDGNKSAADACVVYIDMRSSAHTHARDVIAVDLMRCCCLHLADVWRVAEADAQLSKYHSASSFDCKPL